MKRTITVLGAAALAAPLMLAGASAAQASPPAATYQVTIVNSTYGQPFSPPVLATHRPSVHLFTRGAPASAGIAAIAQGGDESGAAAALASLGGAVGDIVRPGAPLAPTGTVGAPFPTSLTTTIEARPGDRLSLATMLICTNDGFTGLDAAKLPQRGSRTFALRAYDAGAEVNTELSEDIVDPCSGLGPVGLAGDPNGNDDSGDPEGGVIGRHPGVEGVGDLLAAHDWRGPVGTVTVTRIG